MPCFTSAPAGEKFTAEDAEIAEVFLVSAPSALSAVMLSAVNPQVHASLRTSKSKVISVTPRMVAATEQHPSW